MVKKIRPIRVDGDVAYIPLSAGPDAPCAVIDVEDVELVDGVNWSEGPKMCGRRAKRFAAEMGWPRLRGYAMRSLPSRRVLLLHRYLLGALPGDRIGFRDGDPYNCRRSNLMLVDRLARLPDGISRDGAGFRAMARSADGAMVDLGLADTVEDAKDMQRRYRMALKRPDYIYGAKLDPAKLAETQARLAKRREAVGKF